VPPQPPPLRSVRLGWLGRALGAPARQPTTQRPLRLCAPRRHPSPCPLTRSRPSHVGERGRLCAALPAGPRPCHPDCASLPSSRRASGWVGVLVVLGSLRPVLAPGRVARGCSGTGHRSGGRAYTGCLGSPSRLGLCVLLTSGRGGVGTLSRLYHRAIHISGANGPRVMAFNSSGVTYPSADLTAAKAWSAQAIVGRANGGTWPSSGSNRTRLRICSMVTGVASAIGGMRNASECVGCSRI